MVFPAVLEASVGDYRYLLQKNKDGTFTCIRKLIDDPMTTEELSDWAQLPPAVRTVFTQAQNLAAG